MILNRFPRASLGSSFIHHSDFGFLLALLNVAYSVFEHVFTTVLLVLATLWLALVVPILGPVYYFILRSHLATSGVNCCRPACIDPCADCSPLTAISPA